jgi:hypothetical protein
MPYFAVKSGNVFRCVLADNEETACVHAIRCELAEGRSPRIKSVFEVAEFHQPADNNWYILTEVVVKAGNLPLKKSKKK